MSNSLIPLPETHPLSPIEKLKQAAGDAQRYAERSRAKNTRIAYESDWERFTSWCAGCHVSPLPADPVVVSSFLAALAKDGKKPSTIDRHAASISHYHHMAGLDSPRQSTVVQSTMRGIRADAADRGVRITQKEPAIKEHIIQIAEKLAPSDDLFDIRDLAVLLVGFGAALRRSELAALKVEDVTFDAKGMNIYIPRSKTDQAGQGYLKAIPLGKNPSACATIAVKRWIRAARITSGPLFRSMKNCRVTEKPLPGQTIATIIKTKADAVGLNSAKYSGHSLRSGLATSAAVAGASAFDIQRQTGHKSLESVMRYVRIADVWKNNVLNLIDL